MYNINEITKEIKTLQEIIIIAFLAQFIANIVIIWELPKIKRLCKKIYCFGNEEIEEVEEEKRVGRIKNILNKKISKKTIIIAIIITIFALCMLYRIF